MSLEEMLLDELPLNRKEQFFTGTVFPMVVCKDNFRHLHLLLSLVGVAPPPAIVSNPKETNILFFTEYSLIESITKGAEQRFWMLPSTKDTPDIVILIKSKIKTLVVFEAKMYATTTANRLNKQMDAQQEILNSIQKSLNVDKTYHYALIPEKLYRQVRGDLTYPALTWESIYAAYEPVCKNDYFFDILRVSLDMYDELVSRGGSFGRNCEEKISGKQIYEGYKQRTLDKLSMGRNGGFNGVKLKEDIVTDKWRTFHYETSSKNPADINRNWFEIKDFVKLVDHK